MTGITWNGRTYAETGGTHYDSRTPAAVVDVLERARKDGTRVRLFYGDAATGKAWAEESDVLGTIGRSMGPALKVPLMIEGRAIGGAPLLDHCIVAVMTAAGRFAYRHASFNAGAWTVGPPKHSDYVEAAYCDGELQARFNKAGQAARFIGFMTGERFSK